MTYLDNLTTARDQLAANLVTITTNPKPSYNVDGQAFSWTEYQQFLIESINALTEQINSGSVWEIEERGFT